MRRWDTVCGACTSGVSVVCMSSMATAFAAAGTAVGASAAGTAGMGSMSGMAGPVSGSAAPTSLSFLPGLLESVGLGFLNQVPNEVLQPLLIVLLTITVTAAFVAYRGYGRPHALVLTVVSAVAMYGSIYVWMSDLAYLASLAGLIGAAVWGVYLARHPAGPSVFPLPQEEG